MTDDENKIQEAFHVLSQEAKELYLQKEIAEVNDTIIPLTFYRDFVSKNIPLVIRGAVKHWPAINKWSISYLREIFGDEEISVAVTPNGYADAIAKTDDVVEHFVMPEERNLRMSQFLDELENPRENSIFYIQKQNSNFINNNFCKLWPDAEIEILWANETFGKQPDAVNFWMGDERAVTSMHKDPYENIYCVVTGQKNFILHPPTDLPWIPYRNYPSAVYKEHEPKKWTIEPIINETSDSEQIANSSLLTPWICIDPLRPDYEKYPKYDNAHTLKVTLNAGDALYLPSLWFHHVTQSHACISINYWYDMEFDIKYAYFKALEILCK